MSNIKSTLFFYLRMILIWILATLFFIFLRNYGYEIGTAPRLLENIGLKKLFAFAPFLGALAGFIYSSVEIFTGRPFFQKRSYFIIILTKLFFFFIGVKIILAASIMMLITFGGGLPESVTPIQILRSGAYWVFFSYFIVVTSLISFVIMVSQKFGPGVLWNMFIGRYRNPREEQRVFMFLDLKSSTTIAEKLGHIKFSKLIQNCFADLTPIIAKHNVEIYQYVGDEAVLSWPIENAFENNHCIHAYFDFMEVLSAKSAYYEKEYGLQPFFKAGGHLGNVIVAEVGLIKREIAYHGDVLNTTARIQSRCNEFQEQLLVSDELFRNLKPDNRIESKNIGQELLKGKKITVNIHGVRKV